MLKFRLVSAAILVSILCTLSDVSYADVIGNTHVTPSTNLPTVNPFTIQKISDGITSDASPFNGFASSAQSGTITLTLDHPYDLGGFVLWNDINVFSEGINHFRLDFFDAASSLLGSSNVLVGPPSVSTHLLLESLIVLERNESCVIRCSPSSIRKGAERWR